MKHNIKDIVTGWKNVLITDESVNELSEKRLLICSTCPSKINMIGIDMCGLCHCPLIAKSKSDSPCDKGKW